MKVKLFLYITLLLSMASSCYYDSEQALYQYVGTECDTSNVTFSLDIAPLVLKSCASAGCHDATTAASSIILENYTQIKRSVDSNRFYGSISHNPKYKPMPLGGQFLPQCDIDKIKVWIDGGALDN